MTGSWKPLGDRVVIKKLDSGEETTSSGLVVVGTDPNDKHVKGEVVAVGPGKVQGSSHVPVGVEVGDTVLYHKHYGTDIGSFHESASNQYLILHEEDIIAVVGS